MQFYIANEKQQVEAILARAPVAHIWYYGDVKLLRLEDAVAMIAIGKLNNFSLETLVEEVLKVRVQEVSGDSYNPSLPPQAAAEELIDWLKFKFKLK